MGSPLTVVRAQVIGTEILIEAMRTLGGPKLRKALRAGVTKASRKMVWAARARAPVETGALKKSLSFKVFTNKTDGSVFSRIGPDPKYVALIGERNKKGKRRVLTKARLAKGATVTEKRVPANYAHLVEYGHRIAVGGTLIRKQREGWTPELVWSKKLQTMVFKHGAPRRTEKSKLTGKHGEGTQAGSVAPKPFLRPAFEATKAEASAIVEAEVRAAMEKHGSG